MTEHTSIDIDIQKRDLIDGLIKGIDVIMAFNSDSQQLSPSEVAERVGLTRSAARRYLLTLVHTGMAASDGKKFWLMPRLLNLGQSYLESARVPRAVVPFLQRLTHQLQESTNFSILDGNEIVYLTRVTAAQLVNAGFEPGTRLAAYTSTPGRVLLGTRSDAEIRAYLDSATLVAHTHMAVMDKNVLFEEIMMMRRQGYGVTENQFEMGIRGIAIPVKNRAGRVIGALSVTSNIAACNREDAIARCVPALQTTANTLMMWV
jgi:IclR family transcriptional regulator, pca regulon regulatory protein